MNIKSSVTIALTVFLIALMLIAVAPSVKSAVVDRQITLLIAASPNKVGVGESLQILCWSDIYPATYIPNNQSLFTEGSSGSIYARFHNYQFTITHPDGTVETKTFDQTDPLGSAYFTYSPSDVGTYTVSCYYPGESFVNDPSFRADATFASAQSKTVSFEVQEEPIPYKPDTPLPTQYWSRPIEAFNYQWENVASNWAGRFRMYPGFGAGKEYWTNFQPYGTAPNTAHILWANIWQDGGLNGGELGNKGYYTGESYQIKFAPIILNGRLYANMRLGNAAVKGFKCFDFRTGTELYTNPDDVLDFAFSYSYQSENQHGTIDFLVSFSGSTMRLLDPLRGEVIFSIENGTSNGAFIVDNSGPNSFGTNDLNMYYFSNNRLYKWSFFECTKPLAGFQWNPSTGGPYDWANGIVYNVSIPKPANANSYSIGNYGPSKVDGNIIVLRSTNSSLWPPTTYLIGIDCSDGHILWETTNQLFADPGIWQGGGGLHLSSDGGVYLNYKKETMQVVAFDLHDGEEKYITDPRNTTDWGSYTSGWPMDSAYGMFYVGAYDGYIIAYDLETGAEQWRYYAGDAGFDTPYGTYPFFMGIPYGMAIADGKIFAATNEHSPNDPLYKGYRLHVIDAMTGEGVWNLTGWWLGNGIADGEYVGYNGYDGKVYAIGKGPSATTVSAGPKSTMMGDKVIIEGTVTDISAGTKDFTISANYPNGVPAIADESMTVWMESLYMQQPLPTDAKGVEVYVDVIDANGNYRNIGTVTSDISGYYSLDWQPDIPGKYTVIATFAGTESYYASYAETSFTVGEPTVTPAPTATPAPMTDTYVMGFGIAAIVVIIIIGLVLILMLRKR